MPKCIEHLKAIQHSLFGLHPVHYCLHALSGIYWIRMPKCNLYAAPFAPCFKSTSKRNDHVYFHPLSVVTKNMKTIRPYQTTCLWPRCPKMIYWSWFWCKHNSKTHVFLVWCENSNTPGASNGATDNGLRQLVARLDGPLARNEVVTNKPFKSWRWNNMD